MADYTVTRPLISGKNAGIMVKDSGGDTVIDVVKAALPGKDFNLCYMGTDAVFSFTEALDSQEETDLGTTVASFAPEASSEQSRILLTSPTKTWELTVDDTGTLTTTEIT